jgi:hypothetical protein
LHQGYSLNVLRVVQLGGIITLLGIAGCALFFVRREGILRVVLGRIGVFILICIAVSGLGLGSSLLRNESRLAAILLSMSFLSVLALTVIAYRRGRAARPRNGADHHAPTTGPNDKLPAGETA